MNLPFLPNLFRKPEPLPHVLMDVPMRSRDGTFAPSPKTMARQSRYQSVKFQLAVYKATTTPSQRKREAEAAIARLRETERAGR